MVDIVVKGAMENMTPITPLTSVTILVAFTYCMLCLYIMLFMRPVQFLYAFFG